MAKADAHPITFRKALAAWLRRLALLAEPPIRQSVILVDRRGIARIGAAP